MRVVLSLFGLSITAGAALADIVPPLEADLSGTWSFDGSCASGFGMVLSPDGKASYDEWGRGLWAVQRFGSRLVIIVEDISEEAARRKVAELIEFFVRSPRDTKMTLTRISDGVEIDAVKCPSN